jgi:tetratricopeptide (TPR) repeat protein
MSDPRTSVHPAYEASKNLYAKGNRAAAIETLRAAISQEPGRMLLHDELGHALTFQHDYWHNPEQTQALLEDGTIDAALDAWFRALDLGLESHWTEFNIGHALTCKSEFERAARHIRRATDLRTAQHFPEVAQMDPAGGEVRGPDFICIGATKCGTTSLYEYLRHHPQVLPAVWKEIEYFRFPERGPDWYLAHFPRIPRGGPRFVSGEASTCYMSIYDAKSLIRAAHPDVRLLALVRDPVGKTISHCHHDRSIGCESRSMEEAITEELDILEALADPWGDAEEYWKTQRGYVWLSLYSYFLENWLTEFPREQLLVIPSEDLYADPASTLSKVYAHLDLPDHRMEDYEVHLRGSYDREQTPIQDRLSRFFAPHNRRLEDLLGRQLHWQ